MRIEQRQIERRVLHILGSKDWEITLRRRMRKMENEMISEIKKYKSTDEFS